MAPIRSSFLLELGAKLYLPRYQRRGHAFGLTCLPRMLLFVSLLVAFPAQAVPATGLPPTTIPTTATTIPHHASLLRPRRSGMTANGCFEYMDKLYSRMTTLDDQGCYNSDGTKNNLRVESIVGVPVNRGTPDRSWLTFNTSLSLQPSDNVTLAQVAIATRRHRHNCLHLQTTDGRRVPCLMHPLSIRNLMTYSVTHEVKARQDDTEFRVFLDSSQHSHVQGALLVIFKDINTEQIFSGSCEGQGQDQGHGAYSETEQPELLEVETRETSEEGRQRRYKRGTGVAHFPLGSEESFARSVGPAEASEEMLDTVEAGYAGYLAAQESEAGFQDIADRKDVSRSHADFLSQLHERRLRRAAETSEIYQRRGEACQVKPFVLSAGRDLQMYDVRFPRFFQINLCAGQCPGILFPSNKTTYYSYLKSLFLTYHPDVTREPPIPPTNCAPYSFGPISIVRVRGNDTIFDRHYNAKVIECGCA